MKLSDRVTMKVKRQIQELGLPINDPTWEKVFRFYLDEKMMFVCVIPLCNGKWQALIVGLDKPNTIDGKMNAFDMDEVYDSYDMAVRKGCEQIVECFYKAHKNVEKWVRNGTLKVKTDELMRRCKKEGLV